jgi:hypothetical protein
MEGLASKSMLWDSKGTVLVKAPDGLYKFARWISSANGTLSTGPGRKRLRTKFKWLLLAKYKSSLDLLDRKRQIKGKHEEQQGKKRRRR